MKISFLAMSHLFQARARDNCSTGDKCWALNKAVMITSSNSDDCSRSLEHRKMVSWGLEVKWKIIRSSFFKGNLVLESNVNCFLSFTLFFSIQFSNIKIRKWLDSNCRSLVSEATALPTEPQPLPEYFFCLTKFFLLTHCRSSIWSLAACSRLMSKVFMMVAFRWST